MMNIEQLRGQIVRPVLEYLTLWSPAAEALVIGTALQESRGGTYLRQLGGGPALGIYQMEPATEADIWDNFLSYRPDLAQKVKGLLAPWPLMRSAQLISNLAYATAMCRIQYRRAADPLPEPADLAGLASYWKRHYNTASGAGTEAEFAANWRQAFS